MGETRDLQGWNVGVERIQVPVPGDNGLPKMESQWLLVLIEVSPPTGRRITFRMSAETKDQLVNMLTGVIIAGEMPQL